ncbi:MAG: hypothetical protein AB2448_11970 [Moorella sp. (in: firmicutes)]
MAKKATGVDFPVQYNAGGRGPSGPGGRRLEKSARAWGKNFT